MFVCVSLYASGKFLRFSFVQYQYHASHSGSLLQYQCNSGPQNFIIYHEMPRNMIHYQYNTRQYDNIPREYDEVHSSRSPFIVCEHKDDFLIPLILPVNVLPLCRPCPADSFLQEPPRIIIRAPLVILTLSRTMIRDAMIIVIE